MGNKIKLPAKALAIFRQQQEEIPPVLQPEDRNDFLQGIALEHQVEAEAHFDKLGEFEEQKRQHYIAHAQARMLHILENAECFQKPLLTIDEAAAMLSLGPKRFRNIISEERSRLGRSPDFICDADGRICCRVLRDELLEWVKGRNRKSRKAISIRRRAI